MIKLAEIVMILDLHRQGLTVSATARTMAINSCRRLTRSLRWF